MKTGDPLQFSSCPQCSSVCIVFELPKNLPIVTNGKDIYLNVTNFEAINYFKPFHSGSRMKRYLVSVYLATTPEPMLSAKEISPTNHK
jgi:hypothetical protein